MFVNHPIYFWLIFAAIIFFALVFDLRVLNKDDREMSLKQSLVSSFIYVFIALAFGVWILFCFGQQAFKEYLTGFVIEKSLALDNMFIIILIFDFFAIHPKYHHKALFWGIIGAIVARAVMIVIGAKLLAEFHPMSYIFSAILFVTGVKMLIVAEKKINIKDSKIFQFLTKYLKVTKQDHGDSFYILQQSPVKEKKEIFITPLGMAVILIELMDIIFAVDSIPAIFSITNDPYIVYTSNIFAILGLRSLYFVLRNTITRFYYLKYSLAVVLIFIGSKSFIAYGLGLEKFPIDVSLIATLGIIASGIFYSYISPK